MSKRVPMRWLQFPVAALAALLAACAATNRYDGLRVGTIEEARSFAAARPDLRTPRIGLAFGGGGVRGFAHLGVLRALDEAGIAADIVTGTSVGAAAAALYASGLDHREIEARVRAVGELELLDPALSTRGVISGRAMAAWIRAQIGPRRIGELPRRLGIAVTDLDGSRALVIVDGDAGEAVQASASVPGAVIPVISNATMLVDGGVLSVVPVRAARALGADIVIGIDVFCGAEARPKGHALDTLLRTFRLQSCRLSEPEMSEADVLIRPDFAPATPMSFAERELAIASGYRAGLAAVPALRARIAAAHR